LKKRAWIVSFVVLGVFMRRKRIQVLVFGIPLLVCVTVMFASVHMAALAYTNPLVAVSNQDVALMPQAQFLRPMDSSQPLSLSVGLQIRNPASLDRLIQAIYDPQSPQYHHYLTPAQFVRDYAPSADQVQQVVSYLQSQNLTVTSVAPNRLLLNVTGTVTQAQQAFHVQINTYRLGARAFFANATPPRVPASIQSLISSISGLDNTLKLHPNYVRHTPTPPTPIGYGPADLEAAYDIAPLHAAGFYGDNQTIALLELDGYQPDDVLQYERAYQLDDGSARLAHVANVLVDGVRGAAGPGAVEVELDMEVLAAIAPHANQLIYEGPNSLQGLNDTFNKIVTDNRAQIVSVSWGLCEATMGSAELRTLHTILSQGAAQGITFFAAAGDAGAYDCQDGRLAVDAPASDPNVTSVGGTTLQMDAGSYASETAWSDPTTNVPGPRGAGGGGGISSVYKMQRWQSGSGVRNSYSTGKLCHISGNWCREMPDVAANADPNTGYSVYCTVTIASCPATGWFSLGGTSAAAPLWAASTALINQQLQSQGKSRPGAMNTVLYTLSNTANVPFPAFHDVALGNNLYYPATANYDLASGLGTPDVYNIARDLAAL
jgi:kumamolisin